MEIFSTASSGKSKEEDEGSRRVLSACYGGNAGMVEVVTGSRRRVEKPAEQRTWLHRLHRLHGLHSHLKCQGLDFTLFKTNATDTFLARHFKFSLTFLPFPETRS